MAIVQTVGYANFGDGSTTGYYAVPVFRTTGAAYVAGELVRPLTAPAVGNERVYVCTVAGAAGAEPTWTFTRGALQTVGGGSAARFTEATSWPALNGDLTNTLTWSGLTNNAIFGVTLGQVIKRNNGASIWICTTAGNTANSEPAWPNDTAGSTRTDSAVTWTCLGASFAGGSAPMARLQNLSTFLPTAGFTCFVGDNHAETSSAQITITPPVSQSTIGKVVCHSHSGSYPPTSLTTGATVTTTGAVALLASNASGGKLYYYGIVFTADGSLTLGGGGLTETLEQCSFRLTGAASTVINANSGSAAKMIWNNCTIKLSDIGQRLSVAGNNFLWTNTGTILVSGSSVPTNLFLANTGINNVMLEAIDLSQISTTLISAGSSSHGRWVIKDCKMHASVTISTPDNAGERFELITSDSGATAYKTARYEYQGVETTETTITRVGGAVDPNGQAQSRKIVTTANTQWLMPMNCAPLAVWVNAASTTLTIFGTINAGAVPNKDDIWIEVEHLGTASFPLGVIVNTTKVDYLAASVAGTTDTSTWNGGGSGAGWSPFKMTVTIVPAFAGIVNVRVKAAKATTTYYIDPKVVLS